RLVRLGDLGGVAAVALGLLPQLAGLLLQLLGPLALPAGLLGMAGLVGRVGAVLGRLLGAGRFFRLLVGGFLGFLRPLLRLGGLLAELRPPLGGALLVEQLGQLAGVGQPRLDLAQLVLRQAVQLPANVAHAVADGRV